MPSIESILAVAAILLLVGGAVAYIVIAKKRGTKCIGCPDSAHCSSKGQCSGSCQSKKT